VVVATQGNLGSSLCATSAQNRYFFPFFSPIKLRFETTTPPKKTFFLQMGALGVNLAHDVIMAALGRLSGAIVGHVAKVGEMCVFCLVNQNQILASRV